MRIRIALLTVLTLAVAGLPDAGAQSASRLFRGETGQGKRVAVNVGPKGRVRRVTIAWTASCRRGLLRQDTIIRPRPGTATTDVFRSSGTYRFRGRSGFRVRVRLAIRGLRDTAAAGGERWTGTLKGTARIRRHGRPYDRCRLRSTVWSATLPAAPAPPPQAPAPTPTPTPTPTTSEPTGGSRTPAVGAWAFEMTGDAGDYITGGRRWVHGPPGDRLTASGGGAVVNLNVDTPDGSWSVDFAAPQGQQLTAGTRYADATRYPFQDAGAGLSVSGMGRGCNTLTGEFTVQEIAYDTRGVLTRFKASFEQHCEGGASAARGTIEFSAP